MLLMKIKQGDQGMASQSNAAQATSDNILENVSLSKKELEILKQKLHQEEIRIRESFKEKKTDGASCYTETKDEVDSANEDILLSTNLRFSNRENFYLRKILKALSKIESGEYGSCEECGSGIATTRLMARPTSEMCISCKEESERTENQNIHLRASKSIGKKIDLVTNI